MSDTESEFTAPACPACGERELRVVYEATVTTRVDRWAVVDFPNVWRVIDYSAYEPDVCIESASNTRLECRACLYDGNPEREADVFTLIAPVTLTEKIRAALGGMGVPVTEELVQSIVAMAGPTPGR